MSRPRAGPLHPPVIGVCGNSGSCKTLLIQKLVPRLTARGLRVAVIKHCRHHIDADRPGKDSDRIFQAGADVLAAGPHESFARLHAEDMPLDECLARLSPRYHLVLVEGCRDADIPKIWIDPDADAREGASEASLLLVTDALQQCAEAESVVWNLLRDAHAELPVVGAVVVSENTSEEALEGAVSAVKPFAENALLIDEREVPTPLPGRRLLLPAPGVGRPLAAVLGALRWNSNARWIVLDCGQPVLPARAVEWTLDRSTVGADAVIPDGALHPSRVPRIAVCEPTCLPFLEGAARRGEQSVIGALASAHVVSPQLPSF